MTSLTVIFNKASLSLLICIIFLYPLRRLNINAIGHSYKKHYLNIIPQRLKKYKIRAAPYSFSLHMDVFIAVFQLQRYLI